MMTKSKRCWRRYTRIRIATIVTDMRQPDNPIIEANEPFVC